MLLKDNKFGREIVNTNVSRLIENYSYLCIQFITVFRESMSLFRRFTVALLLLVGALGVRADEMADTVSAPVPQKSHYSSTTWIKQLIDNGFRLNDSTVQYPKFPRFLLKVYNWGDRVFNSYDPEYVVATGKNWKVQGKSNNWMQNYAFIFQQHSRSLLINSDVYADIGGYVSFMAVSVGYMFNANELLADVHDTRSNFNFNFTCALFSVDYSSMSTRGGATIKRFGDYMEGKHISIPFNDISNNTTSLNAYYFFNHRKYSHAAAMCYSKYQLKSAGSWIAGFTYYAQDIGMDFSNLEIKIQDYLPDAESVYRFHYKDYMGVGGYAYSWALKPCKWLLNVSGLLGVGYKRTEEDSSDSKRDMVATNLRGRLSVVYNHRALFAGIHLNAVGAFYFNGNYNFINSTFTLNASIGARF